MKKASKRRVSIVIAVIMVIGLFAACGKQNPPSPVVPNPEPVQQRDDIIIAMEAEAPTLHPFDHKAVTSGFMNNLTYNAFFKLETKTLNPVPDLVERYEQVSETEWIFKLRENVNFHDGSHMTAEDAKASMEWAQTFTTTKDYTTFWESIEVVDEYTLKVTTIGSYALTLNNMASIKVVPKALIEAEHNFNTSPIGTGPYKFVSQALGEKIQFVKNDDYFDADHQPSITNMTWRIIPEGSSRTIALEAGEVDVIIEVEANDISRLKEMESVTVYETNGTRVNFMAMNSEAYPFDNHMFRKAVNTAINKESVVAVALNGAGSVAISQTPMVFEGASIGGADAYDPEKAKEYLVQSGIDPATITFPCIVSNDTNKRAAEVIQDNLKELGITMTIESLDYATQLSAIMAGNYQTSIIGYTSSTMCMYAYGLFHSDAINAANLARIVDPFVDEHINLGKTQTNLEERAATFTELTEYLNDLTPFAPLYQTLVVRAANSQLGGFDVSAAGAMRFEDVYWK